MDRSSDKHGPRLDEEMKKEVEGQIRAGHPTRAEEWHDPEPIEDENSPDVEDVIEQRLAEERGRVRGEPAGQQGSTSHQDQGEPGSR